MLDSLFPTTLTYQKYFMQIQWTVVKSCVNISIFPFYACQREVCCPSEVVILSAALVADQSHRLSWPKYCQSFAVICDLWNCNPYTLQADNLLTWIPARPLATGSRRGASAVSTLFYGLGGTVMVRVSFLLQAFLLTKWCIRCLHWFSSRRD